MGISAGSFVLFVLIVGPLLVRVFGWRGNDPTALFGPEWVWNYGCATCLAAFILSAFYLSSLDDKPQPEISYKEPSRYYLSIASGTVESTHAWGRREVVPVTGVEIIHYPGQNCWIISADITQPKGRNGYFAPVLRGEHIDTQYNAVQIADYSNCGSLENEGEIEWTEYRCANLVFKNNEPVSIQFTHINFINNKWIPVASYEAFLKNE